MAADNRAFVAAVLTGAFMTMAFLALLWAVLPALTWWWLLFSGSG